MTSTDETRGLRVELLHGKYSSDRSPFAGLDTVTVVGIIDHVYPADLADRTPQPLPRDSQVFPPTADAPAAVLVYRNMGRERLVHLEPLVQMPNDQRTPWMAGGSYAGTTDSRWEALVGFYGAVAVHDHSETWAQYNAVSAS